MKSDTGPACHHGVGMKLLIAKGLELAFSPSCELLKIVKLSAKARVFLAGSKEREMITHWMEGTEMLLKVWIGYISEAIPNGALRQRAVCWQAAGVLGVNNPPHLRGRESAALRPRQLRRTEAYGASVQERER